MNRKRGEELKTSPLFSSKTKQYYVQTVGFWSLKNTTSIAAIGTFLKPYFSHAPRLLFPPELNYNIT